MYFYEKLLVTSASLLGTSALLLVTRFATSNIVQENTDFLSILIRTDPLDPLAADLRIHRPGASRAMPAWNMFQVSEMQLLVLGLKP